MQLAGRMHEDIVRGPPNSPLEKKHQ